jgi:hypothetical protein
MTYVGFTEAWRASDKEGLWEEPVVSDGRHFSAVAQLACTIGKADLSWSHA